MSVRAVPSFSGSGPRLYVCSTPIGNLQDTSQRLIDILRSVDVVAAEDTRQTRKLLTHFDIHPPLVVSLHQHNELARTADLRQWWAEGKSVALVSDAGTPLVSDPGETAVEAAAAEGVPVIPVPGPSAVLTAVVASGFPIQPFTFVGFLPRDRKRAVDALKPYATLPGALVFYEAPHRLTATLRTLAECFPARRVVVGKEMTKRHETFYRADRVSELVEFFETETVRGEFVIVLGPPEVTAEMQQIDQVTADEQQEQAVRRVRERMADGEPHAAVVREVARELGVHRKTLYQLTLANDKENNG